MSVVPTATGREVDMPFLAMMSPCQCSVVQKVRERREGKGQEEEEGEALLPGAHGVGKRSRGKCVISLAPAS